MRRWQGEGESLNLLCSQSSGGVCIARLLPSLLLHWEMGIFPFFSFLFRGRFGPLSFPTTTNFDPCSSSSSSLLAASPPLKTRQSSTHRAIHQTLQPCLTSEAARRSLWPQRQPKKEVPRLRDTLYLWIHARAAGPHGELATGGRTDGRTVEYGKECIVAAAAMETAPIRFLERFILNGDAYREICRGCD